MTGIILIILFLTLFLLVMCIGFIYANSKLQKELLLKDKQIILAREQAIKQSKAVIKGKINEEILPLFEDFPYKLQDIKFSGQPLDYLVFNGMSQFRNTGKGEIEIIFADVKTNTSSNSKVQNAIKSAILNGRIRFETWKVKESKLTIK